MYEFTCSEQMATYSSEFHRTLLNYGSSVWDLHVTILAPRI